MQGWFLLKDFIPEDRQKVLVTDGKFRELATVEMSVHINGMGEKFKSCKFFKSDKYINGVKYWMPYPKLPKE